MVGRVVRKRKAPVRRVIRRRYVVGGRRVVRRSAHVRRMGMGRRRVMGRGNWWDTIKSGFNTAADFVKDNRLLSRGLRMIPGKYSAPLANLASTAGYGMRRRRTRRVGGRMMLSPPFMGGRRRAPRRRVGGRVVFPAVYTTGMGGLSATTG